MIGEVKKPIWSTTTKRFHQCGISVLFQVNSENIRVPIRLFGGNSDLLADLTDLQRFWDNLVPTYKTFYQVYNAGHCTFMWGKDTRPWMADVLNMLKA